MLAQVDCFASNGQWRVYADSTRRNYSASDNVRLFEEVIDSQANVSVSYEVKYTVDRWVIAVQYKWRLIMRNTTEESNHKVKVSSHWLPVRRA